MSVQTFCSIEECHARDYITNTLRRKPIWHSKIPREIRYIQLIRLRGYKV